MLYWGNLINVKGNKTSFIQMARIPHIADLPWVSHTGILVSKACFVTAFMGYVLMCGSRHRLYYIYAVLKQG